MVTDPGDVLVDVGDHHKVKIGGVLVIRPNVAIPRLAVKGLSGINRRGRSAVMSWRDADLPLECLVSGALPASLPKVVEKNRK